VGLTWDAVHYTGIQHPVHRHHSCGPKYVNFPCREGFDAKAISTCKGQEHAAKTFASRAEAQGNWKILEALGPECILTLAGGSFV